jgi:uncharacterized protein (DUF924 family)
MTQTDFTPAEVTAFWLGAGEASWYKQDAAFDAEIRDRFLPAWQAAYDGGLQDWAIDAEGALGFIILTDQFPRNMFRGDARSFATDDLAKSVSCRAIERGWDMRTAEPERQFFYLPFMHSERLSEQDRGVRLIAERMEQGNNLLHAKAHREIIRRFNRFPYRNDALRRETTAAEQAFLDAGGYGAILREMDDA